MTNKILNLKQLKKSLLKIGNKLNQTKELNYYKHFLFDLNNIQSKLQPKFELLQTTINEYKLQISLYEIIKIDDLLTSSGIQNIKTNVKLLTHEKQYVNSRSTLAQLENSYQPKEFFRP